MMHFEAEAVPIRLVHLAPVDLAIIVFYFALVAAAAYQYGILATRYWIGAIALGYIALSNAARPMAENMFPALWSWPVCVTVTVVVSYMTSP
ncbi:MAG: hypothetical protein WCF26_05175 [Candidatus Sulfotelmatobacter sp.]